MDGRVMNRGLAFMGGVIVGNEMNLFGHLKSMDEPIQTFDEEVLAFFDKTSAPSQTVMDTKTSHEMSDPVTDVFILPALDLAASHGEGREAPFQGLNGRFFIQADDDGIVLG